MPLMKKHLLDYFDVLQQLQQMLDVQLPFQNILKDLVQYFVISNNILVNYWVDSFFTAPTSSPIFDFSGILEIFL
jgi:hypothetical protein